MTIEDPIVHMGHVRAAGLCARGARHWCDVHGIDHAKLRNGTLTCSELEATGDHMAYTVAGVARSEARTRTPAGEEG